MTSSVYLPTATISASTSNARTAYPSSEGAFVYVYNSGTIPVYVNSGDVTVVAAAGNQVVPASSGRFFWKKPTDTYLAALTTSSTATIYFHSASSTDYQ